MWGRRKRKTGRRRSGLCWEDQEELSKEEGEQERKRRRKGEGGEEQGGQRGGGRLGKKESTWLSCIGHGSYKHGLYLQWNTMQSSKDDDYLYFSKTQHWDKIYLYLYVTTCLVGTFCENYYYNPTMVWVQLEKIHIKILNMVLPWRQYYG